MKKIYLCIETDRKYRFIENLKLYDNIECYSSKDNKDIFKYPYKNIYNYIIDTKKLDTDALLFIDQNKSSDSIKIFVYHDQINMPVIERLGGVTHLVSSEVNHKGCLNISNYINKNIFLNAKKDRKNIIAGFLTNASKDTYLRLIKYLEESELTEGSLIRLFDNELIKNVYNLGLLSEIDKANILQTYEKFLVINQEYIYEAIACGIDIVGLDNELSIDMFHSYKDPIDISEFIGVLL